MNNIAKTIHLTALSKLANREYSGSELQQLLTLKFSDQKEWIQIVLDQLAQDNLQSDIRFCENFIRSHQQRGQGPVKIRYLLNSHHILDEIIENTLKDYSTTWVDSAVSVLDKKYTLRYTMQCKNFCTETVKIKAKAMRFLYQRGFSTEQSSLAWQQWQQKNNNNKR